MGVSITYMGTKKGLAPAVCEVVRSCRPGVLLDAFSGMCSVAEEVAVSRHIWTNDVQIFAAETGRALFTSSDEPLGPISAADIHFEIFDRHAATLSERWRSSLDAEDELLESSGFLEFQRRRRKLSTCLRKETPRVLGKQKDLFATRYSDSYFGVRQAIEADAIVASLNASTGRGKITADHRRWLMIALGRALLKISNSTGHFAQFLAPKPLSFGRFLALRRRTLWAEWLFSVGELKSVGTADWRARNKAFNRDSLSLLPALATPRGERPSVIYADPPYTDDQYSRYYHVLDTLFLYDYPAISGAGLYRADRFCTPFSLKSKTAAAFRSLIQACAQLGAELVISYPTNGLLHETGTSLSRLLKECYRQVECCHTLARDHSTFGASKGNARAEVTEQLYWARL